MKQLKDKTALVTGGSRGLGRGIVEALAAEGAEVWVVARHADQLDQLKKEINGIKTLVADVTEPGVAAQFLSKINPDILVLNAGATPHMASVHEQSWEQFTQAWDTDVKATFYFGKEALSTPMVPGSVIIVISSGAAIGGSPLSGGYAGAKRTQWFLADYFQEEANALNLNIRFIALLPRQLISGTGIGHAGASAYAAKQGISEQQFMERMGTRLTPEGVGKGIVSLLTEDSYRDGVAFGLTSRGLEMLN